MKFNRQPKRKTTEVSNKQDKCSAVSVKKPAKRTVRRHQQATESIKKATLERQTQLQLQSAKIKLQLFPINESTRLGLEKDGLKPFLELVLSDRKKISSVVKHLNAKWGSSSAAVGHLMLFPYSVKLEQLDSCNRWTINDSDITAGEVYFAVGSPSLFRLRYAWCSNNKNRPLEIHIDSQGNNIGFSGLFGRSLQEEKLDEPSEDFRKQIDVNEALHSDVNDKPFDAPTDHLGKIQGSDFISANKSSLQENGLISDIGNRGLLSEPSLLRKIYNNDTKSADQSTLLPIVLTSDDVSVGGLLSEASLLSMKSKSSTQPVEEGHVQVITPWNDTFTCLSMGSLFNEACFLAKTGCNPEFKENKSKQPILLTSGDASIGGLLSEASFLSKKSKTDTQSMEAGRAQLLSPWDDTFTCLSMGSLFNETSLQAKTGNLESKEKTSKQPISLTSSYVSFGGLLSEASLPTKKSKLDTQSMETGQAQVPSLWDDTFTCLSMGGLFSEASLQAKTSCNLESKENKSSFTPNATLSDSFDTSIAALKAPTCHDQNLSLLDAEETCHAFPVRKLQASSRDGMTSDARTSSWGCNNGRNSKFFQFPSFVTNEARGSFDLALFQRNVTGHGGDSISEHRR